MHLLPALMVLLSKGVSSPLDLFAGDKCDDGVCALYSACQVAVESVVNHGYHNYTSCGFDGFDEIVCCPTSISKNDKKETAVRAIVSSSLKYCDIYSRNVSSFKSAIYRVYGGVDAEEGEFPHMAALGFHNVAEQVYEFPCGGTLISNWYVITAAHCVKRHDGDVKFVRLGTIEIPSQVRITDFPTDYNIANITIHQNYSKFRKHNDIALLKVEREVTFDYNIYPACLYTKKNNPETLTVTGWGITNLSGSRAHILQKAKLKPVSMYDCTKYYKFINKKIIERQICAAELDQDACTGDSGGPLQIKSNTSKLWILVGVTSYGNGCGSKDPGVYTRISSYLDWIEGIVWN